MAVIGIDLGGTKITGAVFDTNAEIHYRSSTLLGNRTGNEISGLILEIISELIKKSESDKKSVEALGICVPGIADRKEGWIWAPNIVGWEKYPLKLELEQFLHNSGIEVNIASDRSCYILGEQWQGAARNTENAIFISVGTGIGAGILVDGRVIHGNSDIAGAIGWFGLSTSFHSEFEKYGCFESMASGDGMARRTKKLMEDRASYSGSLLYEYGLDSLSSKEIFEAFFKEDPLAVSVVEKAIEYWGIASANLVSMLNPEIVIWGGGVFGPGQKLIDRIYMEASKWAQPLAIREAKFEKSLLGSDAGLYGAGYVALTSLNR